MKRTLKYALSAVLGAALVVPALAQDQFPDVPANHWAYKDLLDLKANGLLVGYPDGLFRGGRPASRYELAVAIHAVWANLKAQQDGLKSQMDDILKRLDGTASKADLDALRSQLEALQTEVGRIKSEDIAKLNRLMDEFRGDLAKLGADVNQMKSDLHALGDRVTKIEGRLPNFDVSGDLNALAIGGYGTSGRNGITLDGRPTGVGRGSYTGVVQGVNRDLTFLHEAAFTITSHNEDDKAVKFKATGVFSNMLGGALGDAPNAGNTSFGGTSPGAFGNQSVVYPGASFAEGGESFYLQDFSIKFDTGVAGMKFNAEIGRVGYQVSPMMFKRQDTTPYYANDRWDNGDWNFDGAILGFHFGSAHFDVFGGRTSSFRDTMGNLVQPMYTGRDVIPFIPGDPDRPRGYYGGFNDTGLELQVDQMLGGKLSFKLPSSGMLNLAYIWLDSNTVLNTGTSVSGTRLINGTAVYGGDVKFDFHGVGLKGSYSKSDERYNGKTVLSKDDMAWTAGLDYSKGNWGIAGGYRHIDPLYSAPGDWGHIGIWWNPTDIQGWHANAWLDATKSLRFTAMGEWYNGTSTSRYGFTGLGSNDKLSHYTVGLEYKLATNYNLALGYEEVDWNLANRAVGGGGGDPFTGGKPTEKWYDLGFGFDLGNRAKLSMLWQVSDYNGKGVVGFNPFNSSSSADSGGSRATGGLITTQLTIKF